MLKQYFFTDQMHSLSPNSNQTQYNDRLKRQTEPCPIRSIGEGGANLPFLTTEPVSGQTAEWRDFCTASSTPDQTYGYLPSCRTSPPLGRYQIAWWQRHNGTVLKSVVQRITICDSYDQLCSHWQSMPLRRWSRRVSPVAWTTATQYSTASLTIYYNGCSPSRMPLRGCSLAQVDVNISHSPFYENYTGCQSDAVSSSRLPHWCSRHWTAWHLHTWSTIATWSADYVQLSPLRVRYQGQG